VAIDGAGNAYATGYSEGGADFDDDGQADVSLGNLNVFVAKYDGMSGAFQGVQEAGGDTFDRGRGVAADAAGNAYVTGGFSTEADFDGDGQADLTSTDGTDVFVVRYEASALPVELAGFTATVGDGIVRLRWRTVTETGNAGFDVQRRTAGAEWKTLGRVDGAGTTTEPKSYRFTDPAPPYDAEVLTYRLRQVDLDGTVTFSSEQSIKVGGPSRLEIQGTYPNPVRSAARVRVAVPQGIADAHLTLFDLLGREVRRLAVTEAGRQEIRLQTGTLPSGMYLLRLTGGRQIRTQKLTIVR